MKHCLFFITTVLLATTCIHASYASDPLQIRYFPIANSSETTEALKQLNVGSCDELIKKYALSKQEPIAPYIHGLMFDIGICVKQNLTKAAELYEQHPKNISNHLAITLRLALIYTYGPKDIRNESKANVLYKQTAIFLAPFFYNKVDINPIILRLTNHAPIPDTLKTYIKWYKHALQQPHKKRKALYYQLKNQGFSVDSFLWDGLPENENHK